MHPAISALNDRALQFAIWGDELVCHLLEEQVDNPRGRGRSAVDIGAQPAIAHPLAQESRGWA